MSVPFEISFPPPFLPGFRAGYRGGKGSSLTRGRAPGERDRLVPEQDPKHARAIKRRAAGRAFDRCYPVVGG